ncbi:MAG: hypothetical protein RIB71_18900 [Imperialibacter sp.]|uniref:hypothetical protein n=1 Tax=Imperialibacter sp. TaxID=2038411 RepID=UPI0032ECC7B9
MSVEDIDLSNEAELVQLSGQMKGNETLIHAYMSGARNKLSMRAPYLFRDTMKVTGNTSGIRPASFAIFYDDLTAPCSGGTGHTMEVCE